MSDEKYDKNNNLIYYKTSKGYEYWMEYDKNNNEIHFRSSCGYESWQEYDENNNVIHHKNSSGWEYWFEYREEIKFKKIRITEQEFIKKNKKNIKSSIKNRFEIMDI